MEPSNSPNPSISTFKSNNFEVKLALNDTQLVIDAEDSTLRRFKLIITPERVQELTSHIFEDLHFMYVGLLEAFEGGNPSIKVEISNDGALTYSEEQILRGLKRVKKFNLSLEEEVMDEAKRQARRLDLQANKIMELEARIAKLEQENNKLKSDSEKALIEKIEKLEKVRIPEVEEANNRIVNKLEEVFVKKFESIEKEAIPQVKQGIEKILQDFERRINLLDIEKRIDEKLMQLNSSKTENDELTFDPACANAGNFTFSNVNKTIIHQGSSAWSAYLTKNPLAKQQKTKFCVRADSISSNAHVMIGICPSNLKSSVNLYSQSNVYCYYGSGNGYIKINGGDTALSNCGFKTGSVISILVDFTNNTISFELNNSQVHMASLDSSIAASYDYYPFVELYDKNDTVSFTGI